MPDCSFHVIRVKCYNLIRCAILPLEFKVLSCDSVKGPLKVNSLKLRGGLEISQQDKLAIAFSVTYPGGVDYKNLFDAKVSAVKTYTSSSAFFYCKAVCCFKDR